MRYLSCSLVLVLLVQISAAQQAPFRWGDVPTEHLELTSFPADTAATALVLFDTGVVYHDHAGHLLLDRHVRIKILTEAGVNYANIDVVFRADTRTANVTRIRGETYNLDENGRVVKTSMARGAVFEEDLGNDLKRVRFTLPQVRVGSVIEYSYRRRFNYRHVIPGWEFQGNEPVLHSELTVRIPSIFQYVTQARGFLNISAHHTSKPGTGPFGEMTEHNWRLTNIPALRTEPFMTTPADYRGSLRFQPSAYRGSDGFMKPFMNTWELLVDQLMGHPNFGRQLGRHRDVRTLAAAIAEEHSDSRSMIAAIHRHVSSNMEWDGDQGSIFVERGLNDVLRSRRGTANEINMLFLSMLRDAGVDAKPVLISTRSHGTVQEFYPIGDQFNALLVGVGTDDGFAVLDATSDVRPMDMLPMRALNHRGWVVDKASPHWIDVKPRGGHRKQVVIQAALTAEGHLEGTVSVLNREYAAASERANLKGAELEDYFARHVFAGLVGVEHADIAIENQFDAGAPLLARARFRIQDYAMAAGDMIYFRPQVLERLESNPLRLPERMFPIDMGYSSDLRYSLMLRLPDGYEAVDLPDDISLTTPGQGAVLQRATTVLGSEINTQFRFSTSAITFEPDVYPYLREMYTAVVSAGNDQIVLRRVSEGGAAALPAMRGSEEVESLEDGEVDR